MITYSASQSSTWIQFTLLAMVATQTICSQWYFVHWHLRKVHWLIGMSYLSIIANNANNQSQKILRCDIWRSHVGNLAHKLALLINKSVDWSPLNYHKVTKTFSQIFWDILIQADSKQASNNLTSTWLFSWDVMQWINPDFELIISRETHQGRSVFVS